MGYKSVGFVLDGVSFSLGLRKGRGFTEKSVRLNLASGLTGRFDQTRPGGVIFSFGMDRLPSEADRSSRTVGPSVWGPRQ